MKCPTFSNICLDEKLGSPNFSIKKIRLKNSPDLIGHGCGEQHNALLVGHELHHQVQLFLEVRTQNAVGFVQHLEHSLQIDAM